MDWIGTISTSCFPFAAVLPDEMRAPSRKRPAVVQRPYYLDVIFFNESEQKGQVNITIMKIVEMNNVRLYLFQFAEKGQRLDHGEKAGTTREHAQEDM